MLQSADSASAWHSLIWKRRVERSDESLICFALSSLSLSLRESRVWCADEKRLRRRRVISALWEGLGLIGCDMFIFYFFGGRASVEENAVSGARWMGSFHFEGLRLCWLETGGYICKRRKGGWICRKVHTFLLTHLTHKYENAVWLFSGWRSCCVGICEGFRYDLKKKDLCKRQKTFKLKSQIWFFFFFFLFSRPLTMICLLHY